LGLASQVLSGGGALNSASTEEPITISLSPRGFGLTSADALFSNADGTRDTRAGSHPYDALFSFDLATVRYRVPAEFPFYEPAGHSVRNLTFNLPPGLVGDPNAVAKCTRPSLLAERCPLDAQVGIVAVEALGPGLFRYPVYNMVPLPGEPAQLGFNLEGVATYIDTTVRSGSDYGITTHVNNIAGRIVLGSVLVLWGNPGDASHDPWRVLIDGNGQVGCSEADKHDANAFHCKPVNRGKEPFLTLPTSCLGPQAFSVSATAWDDPTAEARASFLSHDSNGNPVGFTGCENLGFGPTITTAPDTSDADTPAGLTVEVKPPVGGLLDQEGVGTSDIKNTTVTLPEGLVINPGQAAGLQACQPSQAHVGDGVDDAPSCPLASKIGVVEIETPLLTHSLKGNVYILQSNPPNLEMLVAASGEGVNLKLVGKVHLDEVTGRLTTKFEGTPALPFTDFKLAFSGGAQAALDTPTQCGSYATDADFTPWASPFVADVFPSGAFSLVAGPGGGPCPAHPLPFAPSLTAGSTTDQAGGFTNFSMLLQRGDGQQRIERLQFRAPPGLSGMISKVPLCGEPQAARGTCSSASQIGHAVVASGPDPYPLVLPQPGAPELPIYLTGPYAGAPFGLSIVTPVIAGPFNLGTIVTRAKIEVDPSTAQITVTTDPLPQVVKGVPTNLRQINAVIDRPRFMFNPTNCNESSFSGTAWGTPPPGASGPGATAPISSRFQVGSCRSLEFHPKFSVFASGRNSKANGASLTARVSYPNAAQGTQTNIGLVKVDLPKQLPSRLTTLQKACTLAQFEANPAGCPPASFIGHATVHTPELPVPLTGPAVFVSHGGEAFPTLTMVLQGDGVTIDLVGSTFIDKRGITSTTFKTVPDAPFSTFELILPQGPNSALATNVPAKAGYSLCGQKLSMPTEFVGQNGAVIKQTTPVGITGCAKTKALTRSQKLTRALKVCHKKPKGHKRVVCERAARKRFGVVKKKSKR
jgi:hypothetical protein